MTNHVKCTKGKNIMMMLEAYLNGGAMCKIKSIKRTSDRSAVDNHYHHVSSQKLLKSLKRDIKERNLSEQPLKIVALCSN